MKTHKILVYLLSYVLSDAGESLMENHISVGRNCCCSALCLLFSINYAMIKTVDSSHALHNFYSESTFLTDLS